MPPDPSTDFPTFQDEVFSKVMSVVRSASALASNDIDFHRSSDSDFARSLETTKERILKLTNTLLKSAAAGSNIAPPPRIADTDDLDSKWTDIVEIADFLLERADTCLDEYTGAIKQKHPEPLRGAAKNENNPRFSRTQAKAMTYHANSWASRNLTRPQLEFAVKVDNMDDSPFRPVLTLKPHAVVPLEDSYVMFTNEEGREQYRHPYRTEIETMKYPARMFQKSDPIPYLPFEETDAMWVDTLERLLAMLGELKSATEIAIDLEHHDTRSYRGFVCLMQISTREKDWIVDTLKLRGELQVLNQVFSNPKIIKVLHGASMDIIWLQRDFGLYIVGLFDTYYAAKTLGLPGHGLAFLLKKYVDFDADKQYQLADWRIRPLPEEMFNYARSDTHFLLYIFDHLRNELLDRAKEGKMAYVLKESMQTALRLYEREVYDLNSGTGATGWRHILGRSNDYLDVRQTAVFKAVHQWRDTTARVEDESHHYIMPRHQLFNLARHMPGDVEGVLKCCQPPSTPLHQRAGELVLAIRKAKNSPVVREWEESLERARQAAAEALQQPVTASADKLPRIDIFTVDPPTSSLKAVTSGFWGSCANSSRWQTSNHADADLTLAVPLPQLTAAVFISAEDEEQRPQPQPVVDPGARAEHEYVKHRPKKEKEEDIMVIRAVGGPRKRKLEDAADPQENDAVVAEENPPRQKERKRKKKKDKRPVEEQGEFKPFDYAAAPSVLNEKRGEAGTAEKDKGRRKQKKGFNPYAGSADAPKGLRRRPQERAGKSFTFKR